MDLGKFEPWRPWSLRAIWHPPAEDKKSKKGSKAVVKAQMHGGSVPSCAKPFSSPQEW
jgi:hypothetical protein